MFMIPRQLMLFAVATLSAIVLVPGLWAEEKPSFENWATGLKEQAIAEGISQSTLDRAFGNLQYLPGVIELDRKQPELNWTLEDYLGRVVTEDRVSKGRRALAEHRDLLAKVSSRYGVPARFLVAFWGIESDFGRLDGGYPVVDAIATLAYEGRRSAFFYKELFNALHILNEGHVSVERMRGSWAGAMGQLQFMPSTFRSFAVDYEGDGRIDIWDNLGDAFASAANYLSASGWVKNRTWGREVALPKNLDRRLIGPETSRRLSWWKARGVKRVDGGALPVKPDLIASLVQPDGPRGRAYVVYDNYRVILKWNRSDLFAVAVGTLADRIVGR